MYGVLTMYIPVTELMELVNKAQQSQYPSRRVYKKGFAKLIMILDKLNNELESGQLEQAKCTLKQVEQLRMIYHRKQEVVFFK